MKVSESVEEYTQDSVPPEWDRMLSLSAWFSTNICYFVGSLRIAPNNDM